MEETTYSTQVQAPARYSRSNPTARPTGLDEGSFVKPPQGPKVLDRNADREAIFSPKTGTSIGTWNVRTLKEEENLTILEREMSRYSCDLVGVSETHRLGT